MNCEVGVALLRWQIEKYELIAKNAPPGSGAQRAAEEVVRLSRESLSWWEWQISSANRAATRMN